MSLIAFFASLVLGVSLAAACGLRAFLPLFVAGLAARLGFVDLGEAFQWLCGTPCLVALGPGVVLELLADKVPLLTHLLDLLATPVRTAAGMLVVAATLVDVPTSIVAALALIVGGGIAVTAHLARSGLRVGSPAASGGAATPAVSLVEDVVAGVVALCSVAFWVFAIVVAVAASFLAVTTFKALWQRFQSRR